MIPFDEAATKKRWTKNASFGNASLTSSPWLGLCLSVAQRKVRPGDTRKTWMRPTLVTPLSDSLVTFGKVGQAVRIVTRSRLSTNLPVQTL